MPVESDKVQWIGRFFTLINETFPHPDHVFTIGSVCERSGGEWTGMELMSAVPHGLPAQSAAWVPTTFSIAAQSTWLRRRTWSCTYPIGTISKAACSCPDPLHPLPSVWSIRSTTTSALSSKPRTRAKSAQYCRRRSGRPSLESK